MRLSKDDLFAITKRKFAKGQAKWFLEYLGAVVPCDGAGPILTPIAFEALLAKKLGILLAMPTPPKTIIHQQTPRPRKAVLDNPT